MAVLRTRIADSYADDWRTLAGRMGITESELLRRAIAAVLAGNPATDDKPTPSPTSEEQGDHEEPEPSGFVRLQLRKHEIVAIEKAADALGWRRNKWIVSLVRSVLFREPQPTLAELEALYRSNSELLAIGRNLNQLAHAMHRDDRYKESVSVKKIDQLRDAIARHVGAFQALLEAVERRWQPPEGFRPETFQEGD